MTMSKRCERKTGNFLKSGMLGIAGLVLLLGSGLSWAGTWNPTSSDNGNTAGGDNALNVHNMLSYNTAFGYYALSSNIVNGTNNSAFGGSALFSNTMGSNNSAFGISALMSNTSGGYNTALGVSALFRNNMGNTNTAVGSGALYNNTMGIGNVAVGVNAGVTNITGIRNTFIGPNADAFAPNAGSFTNGTALGNSATLFTSNSIVLGNNQIRAIYANVTTITAISDRRRKKDIKALDADLGLDFIAKLQPISYRFNNGDETERYGFIAQDLEQALPASLQETIEKSEPEHGLALIERQNDEDRTYRVSYGELTAPIVKAIQQQQQEIEAVRQQNAELRRALEDQIAALKAQNNALRHSIENLREQVIAAW
jgi:trimeric autotransporter adhesin